jgi:hypothetical protein
MKMDPPMTHTFNRDLIRGPHLPLAPERIVARPHIWMIALCALVLGGLSTTSYGQNLKKEEIDYSFQGDQYAFHLYRTARAALQVWHQRDASSGYLQGQFTEFGTPAGGCRLRVRWDRETPPITVRDLRVASPRQLRSLSRSLSKEELSTLKRPRALSMTLETEATRLTLRALSAGCPLKKSINSEFSATVPRKIDLSVKKKKTLADFIKPQPDPRQVSWTALSPKEHLKATSKKINKRAVTFAHQGLWIQLIIPKGAQRSSVDGREGEVQIQGRGKLRIEVIVLNTHEPLSPLPVPLFKPSSPSGRGGDRPSFQPMKGLEHWRTVLRFLSYREGVHSGLGAGIGERGAASLLGATLLAPWMSAEWIETVLRDVITRATPLPRKSATPLHPHEPLLMFFPLLSAYLLDHPDGQTRGVNLLRQTHHQKLIGSLVTPHIRDLIRYATRFGHRPAERYLVRRRPLLERVEVLEREEPASSADRALSSPLPSAPSAPSPSIRPQPLTRPPTEIGFMENATMIPFALSSLARVLKNPALAPSLGARSGEAERAYKLAKKWGEASAFFVRELKIHEARQRATQWATYLDAQEIDTLLMELVSKQLSTYVDTLSKDRPHLTADTGFILLWGSPDESSLKLALATLKTFPAGLLSEAGLLTQQDLIFRPQLDLKLPLSLRREPWREVIWLHGITRQLRRAWPKELRYTLEDLRDVLWKRFKVNGVHEGALAFTWGGKTAPHADLKEGQAHAQPKTKEEPSARPPSPQTEKSRQRPADYRGWDLRGCAVLTLSPPPPIESQ